MTAKSKTASWHCFGEHSKIVAIDGKMLRRSYDHKDGKAAIHMVSVWATENHIRLGQTVVDAKSNETTAIPKRLQMIEASGALVTIDAMACQIEITDRIITDRIITEQAHYCLAVKGNQPTLHHGLKTFFLKHLENDFEDIDVRRFESQEKGHGREDHRSYYLCKVPNDLPDASRWRGLKAIGISINNTTQRSGDSIEIRYYILSKYVSGSRFASAVRDHWGIENSLQGQLDVTFGEDQSRIRKGHADENFSTPRRTALSLLKQEKTAKCGVKNKRLQSGRDGDYLAKVVFAA